MIDTVLFLSDRRDQLSPVGLVRLTVIRERIANEEFWVIPSFLIAVSSIIGPGFCPDRSVT